MAKWKIRLENIQTQWVGHTRYSPGLLGCWEESLHLPGNRRNRAGHKTEVKAWIRWAKAFQAEGRASAKTEGSEKTGAARFPDNWWHSSLPCSCCLLGTVKSALLSLLKIRPSYHWWESKAWKKWACPASEPGLLILFWGNFPISCVQFSSGHHIMERPLTGNALPSWTSSTPLLPWHVSSTKSDIKGRQKSGAQETSTTQGNKRLLSTHLH